MADRGNIPNSPACGQWETLLADALDGLLQPEDEATFSSHMASCAACTVCTEPTFPTTRNSNIKIEDNRPAALPK